MRRLRRDEDGWAIVTALILTSIMLGIGLASYAFVDGQQGEARKERVRDSAFNLSEGALDSQLFVLSRNWPGSAAAAYPTACTQATGGTKCPAAATVNASFTNKDYAAVTTWTTTVRDDVGNQPDFGGTVPRWDSNHNDQVWVQSQAIVRGKRRTLVALVKVNAVAEPFPKNAITAGSMQTSNNGKKIIVDRQGDEAQPAPISVRCNGLQPVPGGLCLDYEVGKGQVDPALAAGDPSLRYTGGDVLSEDALQRLRERAQANGTYYTGCPPTLTGEVVFVETCSTSYQGNTQFNSASAPGLLVWNSGTLEMLGTVDFFGVIYMHNAQGSNGVVFKIHGNAHLQGSVAVDGQGIVDVGSSGGGGNLIYKDYSSQVVKTYGNAGIVQNTWREVDG